ncbi:MAG: hypothetical protein PHQ64_00240 [Bacilli bacterium]|nr:hypothetical protein [Bacilli bacterium]
MVKINLKILLKQSENKDSLFETTGYMKENKKIIYYDEDKQTKNIYDLEKDILVRENNEYKIDLCFREEVKSNMRLKESNLTVNIPLKTNKIDNIINKIVIKYMIDNDDFEYHIEYEVQNEHN